MTLGKHGIRALGLSLLAAIGLMAISAAGASATTGKLLILNAGKTVLSELNATLSGEADLLLAFHIPTINLEIHCTKFKVEEGVYLATDHIGHTKLLFSECLMYQLSPLTHLAGCEVYPTAADRTAGTNKGHITAAALILVLNHTGASGSKAIIRAKPSVAGGNFKHLFFKNCPTGSTALTSGGLTLLAHDGPTNHLVKHLFQEATGSFKLDQLKYGLNDMILLGSVWVFLTGVHAGLEWGLC
jgi:hypothetical protein